MLKYLNVLYQKAILYFSFDYFFVLSLVRKRIINMGKVKLNVAIVGTRTPKLSYSEWEKLLLEEISPEDLSLIVSGGAAGIDTYAKLFAGRHHIPLMEFLPDYSKFGIKAPLIRNTKIIKEASKVIAFPSEESRGTFHAISEARRLKKTVVVKKI